MSRFNFNRKMNFAQGNRPIMLDDLEGRDKDVLAALSSAFMRTDVPAAVRTITNLVRRPLSVAAGDYFPPAYGTAGTGTAAYGLFGPHGGAGVSLTWTAQSSQNTANTGPNIGVAGAVGDLIAYDVTKPHVGSMAVEVKGTPGDVVVQTMLFYYNGTSFTAQLGGNLYTIRANRPPVRIPTATSRGVEGAGNVVPGVRIWTASELGAAGTVIVSEFQLEAAHAAGPYRHGDMPGAVWSGTRNDSPSVATVDRSGRIAAFGDSHFGMNSDGGYFLPDYLTDVLGQEVVNCGRGGETSSGIALRAGALSVSVSVAGNTIPAAATAVVATVSIPGTPNFRTGTPWSFVGELAGVAGTLTLLADTTWTFTPLFARASSSSCPANSTFTVYGSPTKTDLWLIHAGSNLPVQDRVLVDVAAMVDKCVAEGRDYAVLPLYTTTGETIGNSQYHLVKSINNQLAARYPGRFIDTQRWLIDNGLAAAGLTPSGADTTAVAGDTIPPALRAADNIHLSPLGRRLVAGYLAQTLRSRNLFTTVAK